MGYERKRDDILSLLESIAGSLEEWRHWKHLNELA